MISAVLVGAVNDNPNLQEWLGTVQLHLKTHKPVLMHFCYAGKQICPIEVYKDTYTIKKWTNGHGLELRKRDGIWRYRTGLHPYDSGSSGLLIFGGEGLETICKGAT